MAFELNTVYGQSASSEPGDYDLPLASMLDAGALGCAAWRALTGPITGSVAMSSRWAALDDMAAWMESVRPRTAPGGDMHPMAVKAALVSRVLLSDVFEAGSCEAQYSGNGNSQSVCDETAAAHDERSQRRDRAPRWVR